MKKSQSETIHVGLAGEHLVASVLSPYCIVRTVGQGKDTGIDLYCEIVTPGTLELFLHFFCQVKTTNKNLGQSQIQSDFSYWADQPVPVFVFHVKYRDVTKINDSKIWIYDVPYLLVKADAKKVRQQVKRDVDDKFLLSDKGNNKDKMDLKTFICNHVPFAYGMWQMRRHGLVLPNPEIEKNAPKVVVGGLTGLYKQKIQQAINYANDRMNKESV